MEENRGSVHFRAFELILDAQKEGIQLEYYKQNGSLKVTGPISDIAKQRIASNQEAICRILSGNWSIEAGPAGMLEWIIATRLDDTGAIICWVRGCDQDVDAWVPEYCQLTGGLYRREERIDGQAWRVRKVAMRWTITREGNTMKAYDDTGQRIDEWEAFNKTENLETDLHPGDGVGRAESL